MYLCNKMKTKLSTLLMVCALFGCYGIIWGASTISSNKGNGTNLDSLRLSSDNFRMDNLSTLNGLSSDRVYSVLEGRDGAIWIGTKNGVDRYNGSLVKNYYMPTNSPFSDASGRSIHVIQNGKGTIFAYDNKGRIYEYQRVKDSFVIKYNLEYILGGGMVVNEITTDGSSFLVALDRGAYRLLEEGTGYYIHENEYVTHVNVCDDEYLVCTNDCVYTYGRDGQKPRTLFRNISVVTSFYDKDKSKLWLGTFHQGVKVYDTRKEDMVDEPSLFLIKSVPVRSIIKLNDHTLLFGVDGAGVYAHDTQKHSTFLLFNTGGKMGHTLRGIGIYDLCLDSQQNLWISSYTGGVDIAIPTEYSMEFIQHEYLNDQSLKNDGVNAFLSDRKGIMYFGTDKGVSILNRTTRRWVHTLQDKVTLTLCETRDGRILAGTYGNGIYEIGADGHATPVTHFKGSPIRSDYVYSIYSDSNGNLWIGSLDGELMYVGEDYASCLAIYEVECITESPNGHTIAVGTTHGGYLVDKDTRQMRRFFYSEDFKDGDYNYFVNTLLFQDNQHIWIGTDGGGLHLYDIKNRKLKSFTTKNGLPSNVVYMLIRDKQNRVWMSTDRGLAFVKDNNRNWFSQKKKEGEGTDVINLNFLKGLEREYCRSSAARTPDGQLVFGSTQGAVVLSEKFAQTTDYHATLRIIDILVDGEKNDSTWKSYFFEMMQENEIVLAHNAAPFTIDFECINYRYQHDIVYQYYMEGYDRQWSALSASQYAYYTVLPPGSYVFHVRAVSGSSGRILGEATLPLRISQPWWNSIYAWILYLIIIGVVLYFVWNFYKGRIQQKYYDEKIDFFVNAAHNIRTPLSLVLGPINDLALLDNLPEKAKTYVGMAQRNGEKLFRMVSELMDFQKKEEGIHCVKWQAVDLPSFLRVQIDKFADSAASKNITLLLGDVPDVSIMTDVSIADLVFDNLISNAVKFTPEYGKVDISAGLLHNNVEIYVRDNGIGIPETETKDVFQNFFRASNAVNSQEMGSGLGLSFTRNAVKRLKGSLTFESVEHRGTVFTLTLPTTDKEPVALEKIGTTHSFLDADGDWSITEDVMEKDTILFVDDNEDLRKYVRLVFSNNYNVVDVPNAQAALDYLSKDVCDIVVSDVMMPGMQGDELCQCIKENPNTSWLPVILLTAKVGRDFMISGLKQGADDYINKPFDSTVLGSKIDSMLKNRRRMAAYYLKRSRAIVRGEAISAEMPEEMMIDSTQPSSQVPENILQKRVEEALATDDNSTPLDKVSTGEELQAQNEFIDQATRIVMQNLEDTEFNIDNLCREMAMSRTLFYGKLKSLTGQTPQDFVRTIRLEQAAIYLKQGYPVLDVSIKTGFANVKYFSTVFKRHFGVQPSKYQ